MFSAIFQIICGMSMIIGNCIGSGAFTCATLLYPFGINAFLGWGLTAVGAFCLGITFLTLAEHSKQSTMHGIVGANYQNKWLIERIVLYVYIFFAGFSNAALSMLVHQGCKWINPFLCYFLSFFIAYILNKDIKREKSFIDFMINVFMFIIIPLILYFGGKIKLLDPLRESFNFGFCFIFYCCRILNMLIDKFFPNQKMKIANIFNVNVLLSVIKTTILIALPLIAIYKLPQVQMPESFPKSFNLQMITAASLRALWPFVGVEAIAIDCEYKSIKTLKKALFGGILVCLLIYILNTYVIFYYVKNVPHFSIADEGLINSIAPSLLPYFNMFIIFLGMSCLQSWTQTVAITCSSSGDLGTYSLRTYSHEFTALLGFISTVFIKLYSPDKSFDLIFDLATALLLIIYILGAFSFFLGWTKRSFQVGIMSKIIFALTIAYIAMAVTAIFLSIKSAI